MVVVAILDVNPAPQIPSPSDPCLKMGGCGVVDSKLDALGVEIEDGAVKLADAAARAPWIAVITKGGVAQGEKPLGMDVHP